MTGIELPWELWMIILDLPELSLIHGILRMVCREWRDYIKSVKTNMREALRTVPLAHFSCRTLDFKSKLVTEKAALAGHLDTLKWALRNRFPYDDYICSYAARGGNLEMLKWLYQKGYPHSEYNICECASFYGHINILEWAKENKFPIHACLSWASFNGNTEVLEWTRVNGCQFTPDNARTAAAKGHLCVLKWAHKNGSPIPKEECLELTRINYPDVYDWLDTNCE